MNKKLTLEWTSGINARIVNGTGRDVRDVHAMLYGVGVVNGDRDWQVVVDHLPAGETIAVPKVAKGWGWESNPPRLEVTWSTDSTHQQTLTTLPLV